MKEGRLYRSVYSFIFPRVEKKVQHFKSENFLVLAAVLAFFGPKFFGVLGGDDLPFPRMGRGSPFFLESGVRLRLKTFSDIFLFWDTMAKAKKKKITNAWPGRDSSSLYTAHFTRIKNGFFHCHGTHSYAQDVNPSSFRALAVRALPFFLLVVFGGAIFFRKKNAGKKFDV